MPIELHSRRIHALVDTSATNQFVAAKLIQNSGLSDQVEPTNVRIKLADGSIHDLGGEVLLDLHVGGRSMSLPAFVLGTKGPSFVMGHPTFWDTAWLINIWNKH